MIKATTGDLLEAKEDIIVHQVNMQHKMNSGLARQIRERYPQAYEDYMKVTKPVLGDVRFTMIKDEFQFKCIAHLFSQDNYGYDGKRYTNYEAIYRGLEYIKGVAKENKLSVAIPYKIGSDRGGADWRVVRAMIKTIFEDYEVTIYKLEEF